jgi:CheY-like chemotaxis protein
MTARAFPQKHILVVDDDPFVCETVTMLLRFDGHLVDTASSGKQALAAYKPCLFDLVITDFFMPMMKGDELADAIKKRSPHQAVMMLTAYPEKVQTKQPPVTSIDFLLSKPFEFDSLREVITKLGAAPNLDSPPSQN